MDMDGQGKIDGGSGEPSRVGRPPKSLLTRVLENTFRPGRYGSLLLREPLPRRPPFRDQRRRNLWFELRAIQRQCVKEPEYLDSYARDFSRLVRCLHGAAPPSWYGERRERSQRKIHAFFAALPVSAVESYLVRAGVKEPIADPR